MVFDEDQQEYRPRFGYKRANNGVLDLPIVEVKAGQDPYADPWSEARSEKKARVEKNQKNQMRNKIRAGKGVSNKFGKIYL
jgi:regulator of ribosome biosynthesis